MATEYEWGPPVTQAIAIQDLERFLERYRRFTVERTDLRLHEFKIGFGHIRGALQSIETLGRQLERQHAPRFNLFRLLGVAADEVNTHSAVLADLLNPKGHHGQGFLFLKTFLEHCQQRFPDFPKTQGEVASVPWVVDKEKVTGSFGNIDLVVESPDLKILLVIENKVGAKERESQLRRYADWMERRTSYPPEGKALIYLTPNGHESETHGGAKVYPMSYHKDIAQWLEASVGRVEAPRVRQTIVQYLEVIRTLCKEGTTMSTTDYETAVINYLAQKENLGMAFEIAGIFGKVLDGQQIKFWRTLERKVKERLGGIEGWRVEAPQDDKMLLERWGGFDLEPVGNMPRRYLKPKIQQEADGNGLYFGIVWSEETKGPPQLKEVSQLRNALEEQGYDTKRYADWWLGLGGKRVPWHLRGKEWCVRIADNDALEEEMADLFVVLFTGTKTLLEKANHALAEIREHRSPGD